MKCVAMYRLLERGRKRLNRIIAVSEAARYVSWVGTGAAVCVLVARWLGAPGMTLITWGGLTLAGGVCGYFLGRKRRLGQAEVASWLDQHLQCEEKLSAALICLDRSCAGNLDAAVVAQAEEIAAKDRKIVWPMRSVQRWTAAAAGTVLAGGLLIGAWMPALGGSPAGRAALSGASKAARKTGQRRVLTLPQSLSEVARMLFPLDPKIARQAEQALRDGDMSTLQRLLAQAEAAMQQRLARAKSEDERRRLLSQQQTSQGMAQNLLNQDSANSQGRTAAAGEGQGSMGARPGPDQGGADNTGDRGGNQDQQSRTRSNALQNSGSPQGGNGTRTPQMGQASGSGQGEGSGGGQGSGGTSTRGDGQDVSDGASGGEASAQDPYNPLLEYILPGQDISSPLSGAAPSSLAAAEAAMAAAGVPAEYQDWVRDYFLQLAAAQGEADDETTDETEGEDQ